MRNRPDFVQTLPKKAESWSKIRAFVRIREKNT